MDHSISSLNISGTPVTRKHQVLNKQPVVEQLRAIDRDELLDLVKMHLSFLIDVTVDEWEHIISASGTTEDVTQIGEKKSTVNKDRKTKMFKASSKDSLDKDKSKEKKSRKELASNIFGAPLSKESLAQMSLLIDFLKKPEHFCQEGIFRKSGNSSRQQELRYLLNCGVQVDLEANRFTALDVSCVLKAYIQELSEPLLTQNHFEYHYELAAVYKQAESPGELERRSAKRLKIVQLLLFLIPDLNRQFFQSLMDLLHQVAVEKEVTKMDERSLATIFGSHVLCPRNLTPKQMSDKIETITDAMEFMLLNYNDLFSGPTELKLDARNKLSKLRESAKYPKNGEQNVLQQNNSFNEKRTPKSLSSTKCIGSHQSQKQLRQSSETLENDTIITFCQASQSNTEEALAELYAQVQAMPETPHKRKLIKQFNKQNGFGTPKMVVSGDGHSEGDHETKSKWKNLLGWRSSSKQKACINP